MPFATITSFGRMTRPSSYRGALPPSRSPFNGAAGQVAARRSTSLGSCIRGTRVMEYKYICVDQVILRFYYSSWLVANILVANGLVATVLLLVCLWASKLVIQRNMITLK